MVQKRPIFIYLSLSIIFTSFTASAKYRMGSFPNLESGRLTNILERALRRIDCRVKKADGVGKTSKQHDKTNPKSCHRVGMAIDIWELTCANKKLKTKKKRLQALYKSLPGKLSLTVKCYNGQGPCPDPHKHHLHFGAIQSSPVNCRY